ncbi:MAG: hypothetical protein HY656_04630 [Acidobacteria bacterium]|nr:hypothetical protein [Acidobacteriota bacterium]
MNLGERQKKLLVWSVAALVLAGALLWGLFYAARALRENWMRSNEARARQTLSTLNAALRAYYERHQGYPDTLERLRGGEEGNPATAPPERARLLESALARDSFEAGGYRFAFEPGPPSQRWAATVHLFAGYRVIAEPVTPGGSGEWFYLAEPSGQIRGRQGASATLDDPLVR